MELKEETLTGADLMRSSRSKLEEWLVNYQRRSRETMRWGHKESDTTE